MNEKLRKALELALKNKGLNEGLTKFITVEKEEEIEGAITEYMALAPPTQTPAQLLDSPEIKSELDRRISAAVKTNTQNLAKAHGFDPSTPPEPKKPDAPDDAPAWAKTIIETNENLRKEVQELKTGKAIEDKKQTASQLLQKSTVLPKAYQEKWANRIDVNSEVPFEDQIKALESEFSDLEQVIADSRGYTPKPGGGSSKVEATDAEAAEVMGTIL